MVAINFRHHKAKCDPLHLLGKTQIPIIRQRSHSSFPIGENWRESVRPLLLGWLLMVLSSCSTNSLTPYSAVANGLVMLEDQCEDSVLDAQTYTLTEGIGDVFLAPVNLVMVAGRVASYLTAGPVMVAMGYDPNLVHQRIEWVFPIYRFGPDPKKVRYHDHLIDPKYNPCAKRKKDT